MKDNLLQRYFLCVRLFTKAPAAALKLLGVSRVASAHSCQLLEVLAKLPEVRF